MVGKLVRSGSFLFLHESHLLFYSNSLSQSFIRKHATSIYHIQLSISRCHVGLYSSLESLISAFSHTCISMPQRGPWLAHCKLITFYDYVAVLPAEAGGVTEINVRVNECIPVARSLALFLSLKCAHKSIALKTRQDTLTSGCSLPEGSWAFLSA